MAMETPRYCYEIPEFRYRLIDYTGTGFLVGAGCGSAFHFIRGLRTSPRGGRLVGSVVRAVCTNGPRVAGRWAAYTAVYCACENASLLARRKDDKWNSIAGGAATGGLFSTCRGAPAAAAALLGAALVAGFVGACWAGDMRPPDVLLRPNPDEPRLDSGRGGNQHATSHSDGSSDPEKVQVL